MVSIENEKVVCPECGLKYNKDELSRSCGNCFACLSCEIYNCPNCRAAIIVKPMKKKVENLKE